MQRGIKKSRPTTMAEFLQQLREKNGIQTKTPLLQLERQFLPEKVKEREHETMYFGA